MYIAYLMVYMENIKVTFNENNSRKYNIREYDIIDWGAFKINE